MAQELGVAQAKQVGDILEECGPDPPLEHKMDFHNNDIGRGLGKPGKNCSGDCLAAVKNGKL
jgi:hypothetical protein